jgi:hypothetical protein
MSGRITSSPLHAHRGGDGHVAPKVIGKAWESKLDDRGVPPKAWKTAHPRFAEGSDAANRAHALKGEQVYRNPANGTFAVRSQTQGERDARVYVYDASGKELWEIHVGDDGTRTGSPAKPTVPITRPDGPVESLKGKTAAISRVQVALGKAHFNDANWVEVPRNKFSVTWTPEESARLPESVAKLARAMDRNGDEPIVSKVVAGGHPVYVLHTEKGWERNNPADANDLRSDQRAWVFDSAGNFLASGRRTISTRTSPNLHNAHDAVAPYKWDAAPALPTA